VYAGGVILKFCLFGALFVLIDIAQKRLGVVENCKKTLEHMLSPEAEGM
jgi:hypothetical protein